MKNFEDLAREVSKLLNDANDCDNTYDYTRWSKNDLVHYAMDGIIMLSLLKPKWFTELKVINLKPGRIQELPKSCSMLTKILGVHNSVDSSAPIASTVNDRLAKVFSTGCGESVNSKNYILQDYSIEKSANNVFYVNPPVPDDGGVVQLDVICSSTPDLDDTYEIPSWMHNLIIEWMLYRAYSSEEENDINEGRSGLHLNYFYGMLKNMEYAETVLLNPQVTQNATTTRS